MAAATAVSVATAATAAADRRLSSDGHPYSNREDP
jgi:hypothetical protein